MSVIFFLLFIAAVVGIFKPYLGSLKRWHFGIAALVCFMMVGAFAPGAVPGEKKAAAAATPETSGGTAADTTSGDSPTAIEAASKWEYSNSKDEMRGTTAKLASVTSNNVVDLDFPYGEVHGILWVRHRAEDGLNVAFQVENGQVLCSSFSDDYVSMKFDNGPVQKFRCTGTSDGSSDTAFIENQSRVLAALKHAKRTVVEAEFYQQGRQQFVFDTAGLDWK
jgi:hypothetical protein